MRRKINYQINESYIMEKKEKLLQKENDRFIQFEDLLRFDVEIKNRLKAMEKIISVDDSENN